MAIDASGPYYERLPFPICSRVRYASPFVDMVWQPVAGARRADTERPHRPEFRGVRDVLRRVSYRRPEGGMDISEPVSGT